MEGGNEPTERASLVDTSVDHNHPRNKVAFASRNVRNSPTLSQRSTYYVELAVTFHQSS